MSMGPIPWTSIIVWAEFHELDSEATKMLIVVIRKLDSDRVEAEAAKQRLEQQSGARGQA